MTSDGSTLVMPVPLWYTYVKMFIPSGILQRLYLKGSLRNTPSGFQLALKNVLMPGRLIGASTFQIDGEAYPLTSITLHTKEGTTIGSTEISPECPVAFDLGVEVAVEVKGKSLNPGPHEIALKLKIAEVGEIKMSIRDEVK